MNEEIRTYFDAAPDDRKAVLTRLHELIIGLYPDARIGMSYGMPTYQAGNGWIAIANQKRYVSLYTCGAHHIAEFKRQYPTIKTGKGCINMKVGDQISGSALEQVVRHAIEHPK